MSLTPEDLAAELPEPQPGEPENLRQDILDELADHLHCALSDEQRRMACEGRLETEEAEQIARGRVIERFGNPVQIACQLWWDAMWEKVMSQRVQTISVVVGVLVVVGMFFLMWGELRNSRAQLNAQLDESREFQQKLMDELVRVRQQPQAVVAPQPAEWNNLSVVCVGPDERQTPVEGVQVSMKSVSKNNSGIPKGEGTTDAAGRIDFGQVLYGEYQLNLEMPNGFTRVMMVVVRPGQDKTERIVCPTGKGEQTIHLTATAQPHGSELPSETLQHLRRALSLTPSIPVEKQIWTVYQFDLIGSFAQEWTQTVSVRRYVAANLAGDIVPIATLDVNFCQPNEERELFHHGIGRMAFGRVSMPEIQQALSAGTFNERPSWPVGTYQCSAKHIAVRAASSEDSDFWLLNTLQQTNEGYAMLQMTGPGPYGGGMGFGEFEGDDYSDSPDAYAEGFGGLSNASDGNALSAPLGYVTDELLNQFLALSFPKNEGGLGMSAPGGDEYGMGGYPGFGAGMSGYGGGYDSGSSGEVFTVALDSVAQITLFEEPRLLLDTMAAVLVSRVPTSMSIEQISGQTQAPILNREGLGYDLIWNGLTINENGHVEQEEHVVLKNIDVLASLTGDQLAVAMSPKETALLSDFCRAGEILVKPTGMSARQHPIDGTDGEDVGPLIGRLAKTRPLTLPGPHRTKKLATTMRTEELTVSHDLIWKPVAGTAVDVFLLLDDGTTIPCVRKVYINAVPPDDEIRSNYEDGVTGTYVLHIPISHRDLEKYPEKLAFRAKLWIAPTTLESSKVQAWTNDLEQRVQALLKQFADEAAAPEESTSPEE